MLYEGSKEEGTLDTGLIRGEGVLSSDVLLNYILLAMIITTMMDIVLFVANI